MSLVYLPQESTPAHKDAVWSLAWAQSRLLAGGADGVVRIYDAASLATPLHELPSLPLAISSLDSTADGKWALATSLDGTAALFDTATARVAARIETAREALGDKGSELPAYAASIHPQGTAWAYAGRGSKLAIRALDVAGAETNDKALAGAGALVDTGKGRFGMSVQFSPDGTQIAVGFETGHVAIVDTATRALLTAYAAHALPVRALTWSPDSQWVYSGSDDARVVLHDVRAGAPSGARGEGAVAILQGHRGWVLSAAASPDGKLLATGGADATVKLWDVGQRACVSSNNADAEVWGVAWQPEYDGALPPGKQFAIAGDDKKVSLYRAAGAV